MELLEYFLNDFTALCEGQCSPPAGIVCTADDPSARAEQLQTQIAQMGIAEFVRRCAAARGETIDPAVFARFDPAALGSALAQTAMPQPAAATDAADLEDAPVRTELREIYEVFLDSVCLDDRLVEYLIDVLKRHDTQAFVTLSHAAARSELDLDDFLAWLAGKHCFAPEEERACAVIMDACLARLDAEGQTELLAALISGDETTFCRFRCDAPELRQLPDATYEWYCRNYLDRYYPVRFLLRRSGVKFPQVQ